MRYQSTLAGEAYLMAVNGNPPTLFADCITSIANVPTRPRRLLGRARSVELAHGHREERFLLAVGAAENPRSHTYPVLRLHRRHIDKYTVAS